jgi:hypothetical protein
MAARAYAVKPSMGVATRRVSAAAFTAVVTLNIFICTPEPATTLAASGANYFILAHMNPHAPAAPKLVRRTRQKGSRSPLFFRKLTCSLERPLL